jgi:TPR repeat protein
MSMKRAHSWYRFAGYCGLSIILMFAGAVSHGQAVSSNLPPVVAGSAFQATLSAATNGDQNAQLAAGSAYYAGAGTPRDLKKAFNWFQTASKQGSLAATAWMGNCYLRGHGVLQDQSQGLALIQQAASKNEPVGLRFLGIAYQEGRGVGVDVGKAISLLTQAASLNDGNAFDRLGNLYMQGLGVAKDPVKARTMFIEGASRGDAWAQLHLGEMYLRRSHHVTAAGSQAYPAAFQLLTLSAAQGNRKAAFRLGGMYMSGHGTTKDSKRAVRYFQQAAILGYPPAQRALGRAFERGIGAPVSPFKAYVWYQMADQQGDPVAGKRLAVLASKLTPTQRQQAQTVVAKWSQQSFGGN